MRLLFEICTCMALALTATSCVRDEVVVVPALPSPSDVIAFGANLPDEATRGAEGGKTLDFSTFDASSEDGSFSLPMAIKVEEGISKYVADTRGAVVDSEDKLTSLKAWASLSGEGIDELYIPGTAFEKNTTTGIFFPTGGESYLWPGEGKTLDFVTVSPADIDGFEPVFDAADAADATCVTEFHYTVPEDVANQPDILVATTSKSGNFGESVPLDFKHIMAAVNFKVGTINPTVDCTIQSITMKGVYDHGTYQITNGEWVDREVEGTNFSVPLPSGGLVVTEGSTGQQINNASTQAFMMIPQQPTSGAEIEIKLIAHNMNNKEYTLRASVQGHVWARNTTTNYLINIDGDYGLQIVAEDQLIDSHYVITKVRVSSEYPLWTLSAVANDRASVTVQSESNVNSLVKDGFWTDQKVKKINGEYVPTGESARGTDSESGTAGNEQVVYVFIPENISGANREITLTLNGVDSNGKLTEPKTLNMVQHSVKWLDPTGSNNSDEFWGCELLIEGGQVNWGFCWDEGLTATFILNKGGASYNPETGEYTESQIPHGQDKKIKPAMELAGIDVDKLTDPNYYMQVATGKSEFYIRVDLSKIGNIEVAESGSDGWKNTFDIYHFEGISALNQLLEFCKSWGDISNPDGRASSLQNSLDYAAMYAMKRNKFYYYEEYMSDVGKYMTVPVIFDADINWYLPAKEQFPILMKSDWGQQFTFNDLYWTSTAYLVDSSDNSKSYAYVYGAETIANRTETYLTTALRRKTHSDNVTVDPDDVIVPGGGDNGPEYGEGGNTDNNQGGDIEGNN